MKEEADTTLQTQHWSKDNLTYKQRQALKKLIDDDTIVINKADKGSTIVILNKDTYTQIELGHLKSTSIYTELEIDPTTTFIQSIERALKEMYQTNKITKKQYTFLKPPTNARTPHIYFLRKTQESNV